MAWIEVCSLGLLVSGSVFFVAGTVGLLDHRRRGTH